MHLCYKELYVPLILILFLFYNQSAYSQSKYEKNFYSGLFYLSGYIASDEFKSLKEICSDLEQVDSLFNKALIFFDGDVSEACLCLTFATLPFNNIKLKLPIIESQIVVPLPSTGKKLFEAKIKNLPKYLFVDSPKNEFGDKDKLSHFFGNAFLSYNLGWFNFTKFIGIFVEKVEDGFFTEGSFDNKDLIVNSLGELFGREIKNNKDLKPSNVLKIHQLFYLRIHL